ncbi:MAG: amidohydrolase family protein [Gemmatimonadaceae bacterium]|nr:amidohydrolase family protein [Gemmatimonadaceae bacterium]MDQ3518798.1 amidohydrolase family protein [Gemmatimonadota bacterium]
MPNSTWKKRIWIIAAIPFAVGSAKRVDCQAAAPEPVTALSNVTLIDGTGSQPQMGMTVLVDGRKIMAIFRSGSGQIPRGATIVDLTGKFLLPGLIDSHVHLGTQARDSGVMRSILHNVFMDGVTAVRDMGGSMRIVRPLAELASRDTAQLPRIYYSAVVAGPGRWFEGEFGQNASGGLVLGESPLVRRVDTTSDVRGVVDAARSAGATSIKVYNGIQPSLLRALTAEAHRRGMKVWSHFWVDPGRPSDVILAGVDVVSHADQFRPEVVSVAALGVDSIGRSIRAGEIRAIRADDARFSRILGSMLRRGTLLDPTLSIMLPRQAPADTSRASVERVYGTFHFAAAMTKRAAKAGIPIVAGTDAIGGSTANLHAELQMLVDSAGLTPLQALRASTLNGAIALGVSDSIGRVSVGKVADLLVLCGNPASDIRNTQTIWAVMKAGRLYHRTGPARARPLARPPGMSCTSSPS